MATIRRVPQVLVAKKEKLPNKKLATFSTKVVRAVSGKVATTPIDVRCAANQHMELRIAGRTKTKTLLTKTRKK